MAQTTTPDSIVYWTTGTNDPASQISESALQASSIQIAFDRRQGYYYEWANATARGNQTGMRLGSKGFQSDTGEEYQYNGSAWKLWNKPSTSFAPSISGTSVGSTGTHNAVWSVSSGRAFVEGMIVLGGTGISVGATSVGLPVNSIAGTANNPRGNAVLADSGSASYPGLVTYATTSTVNIVGFVASGTYAQNTALGASAPFTWATADYIGYSYSYIPA